MNYSTDSTSTSLIQRAKQYDSDAWVRIAKLYTPLVYEWARRSGLQKNDSADVVQEVFLALAKDFGNFKQQKDRPRFRAWMWGIAKHKICDHFRDRRHQPIATGGTDAYLRLHQQADLELADSLDLLEQSNPNQLARRALAIIETDFQERTWKAFWRVTIANQSPDDVAAELGISVASVYAAKSRVLSRLRQELDGLD